jgi:hypothetical protein
VVAAEPAALPECTAKADTAMQKWSQYAWVGVAGALTLVGSMAVRADASQDGANPDDKPRLLGPTYKVGEMEKQKSRVVIAFGGSHSTVERTSRPTVKEIKSNGDVVIVMADEGGKVSENGSEVEIPAAGAVTVTLDRYGRILSYETETGNNLTPAPIRHLLEISSRIVFSDQPVKPGDSWYTELDNPLVPGKKLTLRTTYVGNTKVDGVDAWKFKQSMKADTGLGSPKMRAETTALVDPKTGLLIEAQQDVKGVPTQTGPLSFTGKIERVKPGASAAN